MHIDIDPVQHHLSFITLTQSTCFCFLRRCSLLLRDARFSLFILFKKHAHLKGIIQEIVSAVYCMHANMNVSVCPQFLNSKKILFNIKLRKYIKIPLSKYMH